MAKQLWTILDAAGRVIFPVWETPDADKLPKDFGAPNPAGARAVKISARPDPQTQAWNGSAWVDDAAKVQRTLLKQVKADAETRKMGLLSPGGAKKAEYAQKAAEVAFWDSLGGTVSIALNAFGLLPASVKQAKFGYAIADAAAFGDTVQAAIERFRAGMTASAKVPTIAAVEAKACAAIKAAPTVAAKRAAAAVTWPA